ncbi:hypothetical protein ACOMCU_01285 [Lysinibacillus sp. UGB7]|uniref:hypothetical protein n=1 Tax=Lysinibacillus sp. UGB7 TaxID=3411039 RepID=UPI003B8296CF
MKNYNLSKNVLPSLEEALNYLKQQESITLYGTSTAMFMSNKGMVLKNLIDIVFEVYFVDDADVPFLYMVDVNKVRYDKPFIMCLADPEDLKMARNLLDPSCISFQIPDKQ